MSWLTICSGFLKREKIGRATFLPLNKIRGRFVSDELRSVLGEQGVIGLAIELLKFNPRFDIIFDPEEVKQMPPEQRQLIDHYAYLSTTTGKYIYSIDNSRFTNHSSVNNNVDVVALPGEPETCGVANRDIEKGEEILVNYRAFDRDDEISQEEYLNS